MTRSAAVALTLVLAACSQKNPALTNVVTTHPVPGCDVVTGDAPDGSRNHHDPCEDLVYDTMPPSHGDHYNIWANYGTYAATVPWGFLVHDLEHGAVVLSYDPADTTIPDIAAKLQAFADGYPADPACDGLPWKDRLIIVPEPDIGVPFAASAWGHVYTATCWDEASLRAFVDAHYAMGPENLCGPGTDRSALGWCPAPTM